MSHQELTEPRHDEWLEQGTTIATATAAVVVAVSQLPTSNNIVEMILVDTASCDEKNAIIPLRRSTARAAAAAAAAAAAEPTEPRHDELLEQGTATSATSATAEVAEPQSPSKNNIIEMILVDEASCENKNSIIPLRRSTARAAAASPQENVKNSDLHSRRTPTTTTSKRHEIRISRECLADSVTTRYSSSSSSDSSSSSSNSSSIDSYDSLGKRRIGTLAAEHCEGQVAGGTTAATTNWSIRWKRFVNRSRQPIIRFLQALTQMAARHPKRTILDVSFLSFLLVAVGLATNFRLEVEESTLWTPFDSPPARHSQWINDNTQESSSSSSTGFAPVARSFVLYFHSQGASVVGKDQVGRVFDALNRIRSLEDYNAVCAEQSDGDETTEPTMCEIYGIPRFWNNSLAIFEQEISSDEDAILAMSSLVFADGIPAAQDQIFGLAERDYSTGLLTSAQAYMVAIQFPPTEAANDFEAVAIDVMLELREAWELEGSDNDLRLEVMSQRSLSDEYARAIYADLPLIPLAFLIMTIFTSLVFTRRHKVHSRSLLGLGAVVSVLLSILSGFGFMFLCGVPFTPVTQLLPFVMFGIGLDDAFVIMGAWLLGNQKDDPVERMRQTIDKVGLSITLTSITSVLAFSLGCLSAVPGVFWLCLYAVPIIVFIFLYQLTFFVACIVLDERRIQQNRRDCCICIVAATPTDFSATTNDQEPSSVNANSKKETLSLEVATNSVMGTYASWLLRPWVKVSCLIGFAAMAAVFAKNTSMMKQDFKLTSVLPEGSYTTAYLDSYATYSADVRVPMFIYFRNVDQSDPTIQQQMQDYVADLGHLDSIQQTPDFFWLEDFLHFVQQADQDATNLLSSPSSSSASWSSLSSNSTFIEQLDAFLSIPMYNMLYSPHLIRDEDGSLLSSRCATFLTNFDADNVQSQINALYSQRTVTQSQPINNVDSQQDEPTFNYSNVYGMWEFYSILVDELIATSLLGIAAVTVVALVFIPHWSAAPLVLPLVTVLYIDLLGVMQWAGVHLNAVSYVTLVMSIGLFVDYLLHMLLRYYEATGSRHEKTVEMIQTMGTSILLGGTSTLLGTLPLVLSTSEVFHTVFIAFLGFVTLGLAHGLILLPIILSMVGTEEKNESNSMMEMPWSAKDFGKGVC